ncbi:UDP-glucose 6-dehydrogenase [candidate division TA06 bacterium SM1_40]|uniref:UDP-glucose 6-dehydrogenase n=1 Tax=candidate division TA06 bacterium SM1_40 TaxID=1703773 RepID=A0A0S8JML3_UNCT6|nr:MAG: UDP-glucose 6-dehydrogenase [candidate division TA06 bacterium SM1_40]
MKVGIIGSGYVGLVTGACFAEMGNDVICVDNDEAKIDMLKRGEMPIYEPGLGDLVARNTADGRLAFTTSIEEAVDACMVLFIAVGTPSKDDGEADLSAVEAVSRKIAECMKEYRLVVEKSTVPVQTGAWIRRTLERYNPDGAEFDVASNPEFLREGSAIGDFMHPDRVVIGVESEQARTILLDLYAPLECLIVVTDIESAEMIKHASNSFLAMKISFVNAVANICERAGADVTQVAAGMGYDHRIGKEFLRAGVGFGGICFPKDLQAFRKIAESFGYDFGLLKEVEKINEEMKRLAVEKVREALWVLKGKTVGVLGLSFKPNTDDMRRAPAVDIINYLLEEEATVRVYDPVAMDRAKTILSDVTFCKDPYEVCAGSDALLIVTEWEEFANLDYAHVAKLMLTPILIDGRNMLDPDNMRELGFVYRGIGRATR